MCIYIHTYIYIYIYTCISTYTYISICVYLYDIHTLDTQVFGSLVARSRDPSVSRAGSSRAMAPWHQRDYFTHPTGRHNAKQCPVDRWWLNHKQNAGLKLFKKVSATKSKIIQLTIRASFNQALNLVGDTRLTCCMKFGNQLSDMQSC